MGATSYKIKNGAVVYSQGANTKVFSVIGDDGELFYVEDKLVGLIHHVNDISGIPIFRVWSDSTLKAGLFESEALTIKESNLKQFVSNEVISSVTTLSLDMDKSSNVKRYLLEANLTINFDVNPSPEESSEFRFIFKQDATGGRTVTWGSGIIWEAGSPPAVGEPPVIGTEPNAITAVSVIWTGQEYLAKLLFSQ